MDLLSAFWGFLLLLMSFVFYKESTFGLDCYFWFHQGMNTTSYVGILLLLAGAPKDRDGGICESPLPYPKHACVVNWTLTLPPNHAGVVQGDRCGGILLLPRVCYPFRQLISGANRSSPVRNLVQLAVFGPVSLTFQKILLGLRSFVFHYWLDGLFVPAATWGFCHNLS